MADKKVIGKNILLANVRLAYPYVFEPATDPDTKKKKDEYTCTVLLPPEFDTTELEATIMEVACSYFGITPQEATELFSKPRGSGLGYPILGPTAKFKPNEPKDWLPKGHLYILGKQKLQDKQGNPLEVHVVDRAKNKITDRSEIYGGIYANVVCFVMAYDSMGNKGVSVRLNVVQKIGDGERIGGGNAMGLLPSIETPEKSLMDQLDEVFPAA